MGLRQVAASLCELTTYFGGVKCGYVLNLGGVGK